MRLLEIAERLLPISLLELSLPAVLKIMLDRRALAVRFTGCSHAGEEFYAIEAAITPVRRGAEMLLITKR
jgi:hypothetical protein